MGRGKRQHSHLPVASSIRAHGTTLANTTFGTSNEDNLWVHPGGWAAAVIDGLAGHGGGPHPGQWTSQFLQQTVDALTPASAGPDFGRKTLLAARENLLLKRRNSSCPNASCAVMFAWTTQTTINLSWTGDCRAYLVSDGKIRRLSYDHDILYAEIQMGRLNPRRADFARHVVENATTASEAWHGGGSHAKRLFKKQHLLTSELSSGDISDVSTSWKSGDSLLLTSDGIHDNLRRDDLQTIAAQTPAAELEAAIIAATQNYMQTEFGHDDDMTIAVLRNEY